MQILAIDQSTSCGTVALLSDENIIAERGWRDGRFTNQHLFRLVLELLDEARAEPASIDAYAVDLGPGSFTGVRTSLAAARAMALPDGKPVAGVGSGRAIAWDLLRERHAHAVTVVGDARRGRLWVTRMVMDGGTLTNEAPYQLTPPDELGRVIHYGDLVATPDWNRIGSSLPDWLPEGTTLVASSCIPHARTIGLMACRDLKSGTPLPHAAPVYLHPPVFIRPRSYSAHP